MATEAGGNPGPDGLGNRGDGEVAKEGTVTELPLNESSVAAAMPAPATAPALAPEEKKLTNAELKAKAKAEKAAKRALAKESKQTAPAPSAPAAASTTTMPPQGSKSKSKQDGHQLVVRGNTKSLPPQPATAVTPTKEDKPAMPEFFSHLPMAKRTSTTRADKDVHPTVLALGQHMSTMTLQDSTARLKATLLAFKQVSGIVLYRNRWRG